MPGTNHDFTSAGYYKVRGPTGSRIAQTSAVDPTLSAMDSAGVAFVNFSGADAVIADNFVTLRQLASAGNVVAVTLGTGASSSSLAQIPANATIVRCDIDITTPYSAGATITIGRAASPALAATTANSFPQTAGLYQVFQRTSWGAGAAVVLATIGGAPAAGAGVALVTYTTPAV